AGLQRRTRRGRPAPRSPRAARKHAPRARALRVWGRSPRRPGRCPFQPCTRSSARSRRSVRRRRRRPRRGSRREPPRGRTRRACNAGRSRLRRRREGKTTNVPILEVLPWPMPAERSEGAVDVVVEETLTVHAATIEDWAEPSQAWELTLREGTEFARANNV